MKVFHFLEIFGLKMDVLQKSKQSNSLMKKREFILRTKNWFIATNEVLFIQPWLMIPKKWLRGWEI